MHPIRLISFGYLHLPASPNGTPIRPTADRRPPTADRIEDVRERLRVPAAAPDFLDLDDFHSRVQAVVPHTPGAQELLDNLLANARA